jgi:hypothetical protein
MDKTERNSILKFLNFANKFEKIGVIRSTDYSGDIGEFIAKDIFKLTLNVSKRTEGYDAYDVKGVKYEVKFHNGSNRNNIIMSKYKK